MRRWVCCLGIIALPGGGVRADDLPTVTLEAPKEWGQERIELPPGFAPDMTVSGFEEIRFAPGMFQAESDSFFSYVLVFVLEGESLEKEKVKDELLTYYRGLADAVGSGRGLTIDVDAFTLEWAESEDDGDDSTPEDEEPTEWVGTLNWIEPFATGEVQELRIEVGVGAIAGSAASHITMCVSPQAADAEIWEAMHGVRDGVEFSTEENRIPITGT